MARQRSRIINNEAQTQFLGPNTVLGKMFRYNSDSDHQVAATASSAKGG